MKKRCKIVLEIIYPESSRRIDDEVIKKAIEDFLKSTPDFHFDKINIIESMHWENWEV